MVGLDAYLKAFAAAVCLSFAVALLGARRLRGTHLHLGAFFLLLAGNQGAETLRALATGTAAENVWWAVATLFAAFDPLAFYLFGRSFAEGPPRRWPVALVSGSAVALAAGGLFIGLDERWTRLVSASLLLFTALVYAVVLLHLVRAHARDPADRRARVLLIAAALVIVLPWKHLPYALTEVAIYELLGASMESPERVLALRMGVVSWLLLLAGIFAVGVAASRLANGARVQRTLVGALLAGTLLTAVLTASTVVTIPRWGENLVPEPAWMPGLLILGRSAAPVRWIVFGALVSTAVLRDDLLGLSLTRRRVAARTLVAVGMVGTVGLAYAVVAILYGAPALELRPLDWVMLGLVLLATQGFRPLIDRVASRVYGVPLLRDRAHAQETYRRAIQQALAEGIDPRADAGLARLRSELRIEQADAEFLERVAEERVAAPLVPGQRLAGRYLVRRLVGRGGAGRVFLARDEALTRDIVLKEVLDDESQDAGALHEARAAGGILHPNIVVVHDVLRRPGLSILVTEYVSGGSLADRVREAGPLPLEAGLRVLDGVLAGLEVVHARGLIHRDLKPGNVLLTEAGSPKLADFGIARARRGLTARFDEPDAFIGTPEFMAPEQRAGQRATPATDVYGVGRLARECIVAPLPAAVEAVVTRATTADPGERFASASEMRRALAAALRP